MSPAQKTQEKRVPSQAIEAANDQKQQIEDQRAQLESLKRGGGDIWVDQHKTVPATIPENQKKKDPTPFQSTPLFGKDGEGNAYTDADGNPTKQPVYFDIFRYDAAGQLDVSQRAQPLWFSRTIATTYQLTNEHQAQLDESADVLPRILPGLFPQAAWAVVDDDQTIHILKDGLTTFMEQKTKGLKQESGLIGQTTPLVKEFFKGNAFGSASDSQELADAKASLDDAQKELLAANLGVNAKGGRVVGFADDSGASISASEYKKDWKKCAEKIRNENINLAWQSGQYTGNKLGAPYTVSLYYDSRMMNSEEGRKLLCDQIDAHLNMVQELFSGDLSQFPPKEREKIQAVRDAVAEAAGREGRGGDAAASIARVAEELQRVRLLIASGDPAAAKAFFDFKLKYAITQNCEVRHPDEGSSETTGKSYGGEGWIASQNVAGYLAFNLAMDYTGRGTVFVPSNEPVLNVGYGVDSSQSRPQMGVGTKEDGKTKYGADEGYARVLWHVTVRSDSACKEYGPAFSNRLMELAWQANSVWNAGTGRFEPIDNITVQPDVRVTDHGNGEHEYVVEIRDPYQVQTHKDVKELHKTVRIPDLVGAGSKPLAVYEMNAWLPMTEFETHARILPEPSPFRLGIMAGLTSVPTYGYTKNLFKGGGDANSGKEGLFGQRNESAGGYVDMFSNLGYSPLSNYENARRATYWSDRQYNAYRFAASGLLNQPMFDAFGTKTVGGNNYLAGFDLTTLQNINDQNKDSIVKNLFTSDLSNQLPQDPVLKDKPYDFLDSIAKIREWSPLNAIITETQLWKGWLIQARNLIDPNDAKTLTLLDDKIDEARGFTISKPANYLFPTLTRGVAAWGVTMDMLAGIGESARQHGITAIFSFNPQNRLMVTFAPALGDVAGLGQSIYNPNFPLTTKLVNASMFVINEQFNLYKYEGDRSIFNMDFVAEVGLFWTRNPYDYKYNTDVWNAWAPLATQWSAPVGQKNAQVINNAAKALKGKLLAKDQAGRDICDIIINYSDPYNPNADATSATGNCANALRLMSEHLSTQMYFGGQGSGTFMESGMYGNGLGTYQSIDSLFIGGRNIMPFGNIRVDWRFKEKDTRLLGLFPQGTGVDLDVVGSIFIPSAPYTAAFELFNKDRAVSYAINDMPQITKNWIPPIPFRLMASRTVPILADLTGDFGASLSANATAVQLSEVTVFARLYSGSVLPGTNTQFSVEAGYAGTGLGTLNPTLRTQLQTYTPIGPNARLGASVDYMFSKLNWGQVSNFGVRLQFTYMFGGPYETKTPSGETKTYLPNTDSRYSPLQWEKFGDPNAAHQKYLDLDKARVQQNPAPLSKPIEPLKTQAPGTNIDATTPPSTTTAPTGTTTPATTKTTGTETPTTGTPDAGEVTPKKVTATPKKVTPPPAKTEPKKETPQKQAPKKEEEEPEEAVPLEPEEKKGPTKK